MPTLLLFDAGPPGAVCEYEFDCIGAGGIAAGAGAGGACGTKNGMDCVVSTVLVYYESSSLRLRSLFCQVARK